MSELESTTAAKDTVYVIDGYGMIYRSYFAFMRSPITNTKGQNVSALFGFFRVLISFIKQYRPRYLGVAMDSRTPTFRDELFAEYKATRQSTPDDLKAQFPLIEAVLEALGLPMLRVDGFEADDVMATLATRCGLDGHECVVVSADKDMLQLVADGVRILKPAREGGGFTEMNRQAVFDEKGVWPEQIIDYLSLLGDTADNVPGVKGIGEKSAAKLLEDFGSLDGIFDGIDSIASASQKQKLADGKENALFSRKLVSLRHDVPLPGFDAEDCFAPLHIEGFNGPAAAALLREQGIRQLAVEIAALGKSAGGNFADSSAPETDAVQSLLVDSAGPTDAGGAGSASDAGSSTGTAAKSPPPAKPGAWGEPSAFTSRTSGLDAGFTGPEKTYDASLQKYEIILTIPRAAEIAGKIREAGSYVLDTETDGLDAHTSRLVGISISLAENTGWYLPLWGPVDSTGAPLPPDAPEAQKGSARIGPILPENELRALLKPLIEDPSLKLIGQNIKFDYQMLKAWGVTMANPWFDTMIAAWLVDTTANQYNMDDLARRLLGYETIHFADLFEGMEPLPDTGAPAAANGNFDFGADAAIDAADKDDSAGSVEAPPQVEIATASASAAKKPAKLKAADMRFSRIAVEKGGIYSAEDVDITFRLYRALEPKLTELKVDKLFHELEMPLVPLLAEMEWRGMTLRADKLREYSIELTRRLAETEQSIYALVGHPFNIASTKQLQEVLFVERKLQGTKKTKTGWSTDTSVLEELAPEDPVPQKILDYRGLAKLKSTYADTLPLLQNPKTGRIHTSLVQTGTATGRMSSKDPNLQNIPIKDEDGRRIREAFVPQKGSVFVSADYSQIELVVLAHYAQDPGLSAAFRSGVDVHRATGSLIFGVPPEEVSAEQRRMSKTINFGVMYGMSAFRLARELSIPQKQAQAFIDAYFATYSGIKRFIESTVKQAEIEGGVRTMLGRFRPVPSINSRNRTEKQAAERIAVNTPIQGTAADIVKLAMLAVARRLKSEGLASALVLQVHDELILEVPEAEKERVMALVAEEMAGAVTLDVPLRSSVEWGTSWGAMH